MNLEDVRAVIASARARGPEPLEKFIRERIPDPIEGEVEDARDVCIEIIEAVPTFLERAQEEARSRSLEHVVDPLLEHAARYFVTPIDMIPEMTWGLAGLLDDAYLVLRILRDLDDGPEPFLDWELEEPVHFLEQLVGPTIASRLDGLANYARRDAEQQLLRLWDELGADA